MPSFTLQEVIGITQAKVVSQDKEKFSDLVSDITSLLPRTSIGFSSSPRVTRFAASSSTVTDSVIDLVIVIMMTIQNKSMMVEIIVTVLT